MNKIAPRVASRALVIPSALCALLLFFAGGCGGNKETRQTAPPVRTGILRGNAAYWGIAMTEKKLLLFDTKDSTESALLTFSADTSAVEYALSPARNKLLIGYYDTEKKNTLLYIYMMNERQLHPLKNIKGLKQVNLLWLSDSLFLINTYDKKIKVKSAEYSGAATELHNAYSMTMIKSFKPKGGAVLLAALRQKYFVYGDSKDLAIIDAATLKIHREIKDLNLNSKNAFAFSPDGAQLIVLQPVKTKTGALNQLLASRYDGRDDKLILDTAYDPSSVQWLPNSNSIVCSIRSLELAGVRHVALIDMSTYKTSFRSGGYNGSVPSMVNTAVSPGGNFLLISRTESAAEGGRENYIVRDLKNDRDFVLKDSLGVFTSEEVGEFTSWPQEAVIVFLNRKYGAIAYNLVTRNFSSLPNGKILFVQERE